jgi:hypothetical protein
MLPKDSQEALALECYKELAPEIAAAKQHGIQLRPEGPSLDEVLGEFWPNSSQLFLGIADDNLPIYLNLDNRTNSPLLVQGRHPEQNTQFLQMVVAAVIRTKNFEEVQFGVITSNVNDWQSLNQTKHCTGVFPIYDSDATDFILALCTWAKGNKKQQSVLLLLDGLEKVSQWNEEARDNLTWLLQKGPSNLMLPIITWNQANTGKNQLVANFRTIINAEGNGQFSMPLENQTVQSFWIPSIG